MCRKHDHHVDEVRYSGGMVDALAIFAGGVCPEVAIKEKLIQKCRTTKTTKTTRTTRNTRNTGKSIYPCFQVCYIIITGGG